MRKQPPLTEDQLELLEQGFPVTPNYTPFFYEDRSYTRKLVKKMIEQRMKEIRDVDPAELLYG